MCSKWSSPQCIKRTSTLRFSAKGSKPRPTIVFHYGDQSHKIREFLETRDFVLKVLESLKEVLMLEMDWKDCGYVSLAKKRDSKMLTIVVRHCHCVVKLDEA